MCARTSVCVRAHVSVCVCARAQDSEELQADKEQLLAVPARAKEREAQAYVGLLIPDLRKAFYTQKCVLSLAPYEKYKHPQPQTNFSLLQETVKGGAVRQRGSGLRGG